MKHGKARQAVIRLDVDPQRLLLSVTDNGQGFPKVLPRNGGMGLRIMRYRAGMIGGLLSTESLQGGGAAVICTVPKSGQKPDESSGAERLKLPRKRGVAPS